MSYSSKDPVARLLRGPQMVSPSSARLFENTFVQKVTAPCYIMLAAYLAHPIAMNALSIPTSRALALISLPALPVERERREHACILTRVAPSFIRIGCFEAFNGPSLAFGGVGQQKPHWDGLRILGEWVSQRVLKLNIPEGEPWSRALLFDVAERNAKMVAAWQVYGFMHGVINTDKWVQFADSFSFT